MLKIVIPLAGSSEQFYNAGYAYPKPLIDVKGTPMVQLVVEKVSAIAGNRQLIFIVREEDARKYHLDNTLRLLSPDCEVIRLKKDTRGGLCSVLMAIDKVSGEDELLVLNGDQVIDEDFTRIMDHWKATGAEAGVVTFKSVHPRWSYARIADGEVVQTAEKNPISQHAIAGYYYFARASVFFECAFSAIKNDVQTDGNYYISPVMNEYVLLGRKVMNYHIATGKYHSFYSPQMLKDFESK
ncbi:glycosyltransferase family 2 protein [Hufsiella ginkgonis]|uniref:NTP transferase domain-containing protein n=1 Tax=Hufsiella ginkgonis TaxID=2695274 RepID=A0A7K1Y2Z4_9SPHI|nr:glycosyltransferase family 2 protein [Hufsiella ginkgonis]MXV17468.1 NTP transferase domain-containing protein [Hufsiella ginkgonis]